MKHNAAITVLHCGENKALGMMKPFGITFIRPLCMLLQVGSCNSVDVFLGFFREKRLDAAQACEEYARFTVTCQTLLFVNSRYCRHPVLGDVTEMP